MGPESRVHVSPSPPGRAIGVAAGAVALAMLVWVPSVRADPTSPSARSASSASASASATGPDGCLGVIVPPGATLGQVMASRGAGTTYCLLAGSYDVATTISTEAGDRVIGAGRDATFIDGSGLPPDSVGIFEIDGDTYFANLDIFGAPTPSIGNGDFCGTPSAPHKSNCGKAFAIGGSSLTIRSIGCHDNGGNCIGGGGSAKVSVDDIDCWNNGNAYSMSPEFRYAACIKRAAVYSTPGDTMVTDSYIHDNPWVGIWCDFCKYGSFEIERNRIVHNGAAGIQWEMSGGWTSSDHALITNNVIRDNNYRGEDVGAGVNISTANDVTIESNEFEGNRGAGVNILFTSSRNPPQPDSVGVVVRSNTFRGDAIVGCGRAAPVRRLAVVVRSRLGVGLLVLLVLVVLLLLGLALRLRPRLLLVGFAGGLVVAFLLLAILPVVRFTGAACIANA